MPEVYQVLHENTGTSVINHRLLTYWKLVLTNKYVYIFINCFFKKGKKYKSFALFEKLLINLKKILLLPPLFILQSALFNYKNIVRMRTKQFRRKKFYYFSLLSGERQVKASITYLSKKFKIFSKETPGYNTLDLLTSFILNLFFKTSLTHGRFIADQLSMKRRFNEIFHRRSKKNKKRFKGKSKSKSKRKPKSYLSFYKIPKSKNKSSQQKWIGYKRRHRDRYTGRRITKRKLRRYRKRYYLYEKRYRHRNLFLRKPYEGIRNIYNLDSLIFNEDSFMNNTKIFAPQDYFYYFHKYNKLNPNVVRFYLYSCMIKSYYMLERLFKLLTKNYWKSFILSNKFEQNNRNFVLVSNNPGIDRLLCQYFATDPALIFEDNKDKTLIIANKTFMATRFYSTIFRKIYSIRKSLNKYSLSSQLNGKYARNRRSYNKVYRNIVLGKKKNNRHLHRLKISRHRWYMKLRTALIKRSHVRYAYRFIINAFRFSVRKKLIRGLRRVFRRIFMIALNVARSNIYFKKLHINRLVNVYKYRPPYDKKRSKYNTTYTASRPSDFVKVFQYL